MATTKRRSPTSTLVSKGAISSAASILGDLPEKPKEIWSLREAIDLLKEPISAALDRGYSYAEVSKMLTEKGVEISPSTLKYYLSSARREKDGSKPKMRRRRKTQGITLNPETVTLRLLQNALTQLQQPKLKRLLRLLQNLLRQLRKNLRQPKPKPPRQKRLLKPLLLEVAKKRLNKAARLHEIGARQ